MLKVYLLRDFFNPWYVMWVFIIRVIYLHILYHSYKRVVCLHVPNTNVSPRPCGISSGQETVKNMLVQDMSQWTFFLRLHCQMITSRQKRKIIFLADWGDGLLIKIHSGSIFFIFFHASACPYAVFRFEPCLWSIGCPTLAPFRAIIQVKPEMLPNNSRTSIFWSS